jgi:protein-S-isoprenylcysteine O-methyltransferase Ste14
LTREIGTRIDAGSLFGIVLVAGIGVDLVGLYVFKNSSLRFATWQADRSLSLLCITAGALLLAAGCILGYLAHEMFHHAISEDGQIDELFTQGVYTRVRHPFYSGLSLIGLSLVGFCRSFSLLGAWLILTVWLYFAARREEEYLFKKFGAVYGDYKRQAGMFLPRFWRKR